jgi:hypothetical protein
MDDPEVGSLNKPELRIGSLDPSNATNKRDFVTLDETPLGGC